MLLLGVRRPGGALARASLHRFASQDDPARVEAVWSVGPKRRQAVAHQGGALFRRKLF